MYWEYTPTTTMDNQHPLFHFLNVNTPILTGNLVISIINTNGVHLIDSFVSENFTGNGTQQFKILAPLNSGL